MLEGGAVPILHRSQLATLLDLPRADEPDTTTLAWDCAALLGAWLAGIEGLPLDRLTAPTRSRGRSLRNLTVNVFHPFELLPTAWRTGVFAWDPDGDEAREAALRSGGAIRRYATVRRDGWLAFLGEHADTLAADRAVASPRGQVSFGDLLAQQRWHVAFHYRQLVAHRAEAGSPVRDAFPLERLDRLDLSAATF